MMKTIEDELREEWERSHFEDEEEAFDFKEEYGRLLKISDYEFYDTVGFLLGCDHTGEDEIQTIYQIVKNWWREKPQRLDCNEFWEICASQFEEDCFDLAQKHLESV